MKILLLLPLLLGFSVPAIAHNEANGGSEMHVIGGNLNLPNPNPNPNPMPMPMPMPPMDEEGEEGPIRENIYREDGKCFGICY